MLRYPVNFVGITQYYSDRHKGLDLGWKDTPDDPVFAAADGVVVDCGTESVYGAIYAVVRHAREGGLCYTVYWHLRSLDVVRGQSVSMGQRLGIMGDTGLAAGVHLHYETWLTGADYTNWRLSDRDKYAVDPRSVTYLYPDQQVSPNSRGVMPLPEAAPLELVNEPLYASSTSASAATAVTGAYWRWDEATVNGRIRITNAPERIGVPGQVTGWIASPEAVRRTYTVVSGDTLSGIAAAHGLTLAQIIALNPQIENPNLIYPGQTVYLS
jgi:murein DD-endopeptidase MepM/ murein hydrolase activator NlpD